MKVFGEVWNHRESDLVMERLKDECLFLFFFMASGEEDFMVFLKK